jgi:2-hydroxy-3-oxopropionate reductase
LESIGFIGLGTMGKPMAHNLLRAGYKLVVHNRSPEAVQELVSHGAESASNPRELTGRAGIYITMLPETPDVEEVVLGPDGLLPGLTQGSLLIDMSTIDPEMSRRISREVAGVGGEALDAPVSGGQIGAEKGQLSVMVGGTTATYNRALPVFEVLGRNIVHVGGAGAGQIVKAANQIVVGITIQAVAEALTLAGRAGVDMGKTRNALMGGFAHSRVLEVHGRRMLEGDFRPGFKSRLHLKDLGIALDAARRENLPLPCAELVHEFFSALVGRGSGDDDHSALIKVLGSMVGEGQQSQLTS